MSKHNWLKVTPFRQTAGLCGPASLKIALSYFGRDHTEEELSALTGATPAHGTEHEDLIKVVEQLGGTAIVKEDATLADIEDLVINRRLPVIIGWFDVDEDHYSVVVGITPKYLITQDPEVGGVRRLAKKQFPAIWFDFVGPDNKEVSRHWLLAIDYPAASPLPS